MIEKVLHVRFLTDSIRSDKIENMTSTFFHAKCTCSLQVHRRNPSENMYELGKPGNN